MIAKWLLKDTNLRVDDGWWINWTWWNNGEDKWEYIEVLR